MSRSHNQRSLGHEHGARSEAKKVKRRSHKKARQSNEDNFKALRLIERSVYPVGWMRVRVTGLR